MNVPSSPAIVLMTISQPVHARVNRITTSDTILMAGARLLLRLATNDSVPPAPEINS